MKNEYLHLFLMANLLDFYKRKQAAIFTITLFNMHVAQHMICSPQHVLLDLFIE